MLDFQYAAEPSVLVTGGCGFIGINLGRHLVARGYRPLAYDNLKTGSAEPALAGGYGEIALGDILDSESLTYAARNVDAVIHLAAHTGVSESVEDPRHDVDVNVVGTLNALLAARDGDARCFVFASSNAPLGAASPPASEAVVPRPRSPYGAGKLAGEALCAAFATSFGLPTAVLRFSNVYGPQSGHKQSVVARFVTSVLEDLPLVVYGDGQQTRDFIYVDDLCRGIVAALDVARDRKPQGDVFHIGTGVETTVADLVGLVRELFSERDIKVDHRPTRPEEVTRSYSDITRARIELGWEPSVSLREGLAATRDWFCARVGV
ncbi:MAG TPA: NAD-dependent epimerase/dehydratase family protein [Acidimicrobiia bacterium]|nr:NAD-dependent epimerase/dehydratase family protein [Acidimicrobiia bacterium]